MTGPTLQLNINQTGQAKVEATTRAVEGLVAALRSLPAAAAEVAKLQKALNAPTAGGGGLRGAAADQKALLGELKNLGAQLGTSFASLEQTIQKGWAKAAKAQETGEASLRSSSRRPRPTFQLPSGGEVDAAWFAKMQVGAERIEQRRLANEARAQERATRAFMKRYEDEARQQRRMQVESAKMAEAQRVAEERAAAQEAARAARREALQERIDARHRANYERQVEREAQRLRNLQINSAKMAEAQREADERALASQAAAAARREAALERADARHRANYERELAREAQRLRNLQVQSARMAEAARVAAEKEAAASLRAAEKKEAATQQADAKLRAQFEREYAREAQRVRDLQVQSAKMAEASRLAAEKEAAAIRARADRVEAAQRAANAKFDSLSERGQARAIVRARSQLDQGIAPAVVGQRFGAGAVTAAQYTDLATAKQRVGDMAARATPQIRTFGVSMADAHSAARGLASGFGAMYLTWGRVAPLLAGAALSQSFVQSVKVGADVRQELETIRVLSQESQSAVAALESQLIQMGQNGPFGPREVAGAMRVLSLAGLNASQVAASLKPSLDLAVTGNTTIEKSSEALVAVGTAYGYLPEQFGVVADAMSKAAAISMSSVDGMMESFRSSSAVAQQYKVSLQDTATALAMLANVGIRNSAAGTAVRQMYAELSGASGPTREAMKKLKVEIVDVEKGGVRPLLDIVKDLDKAMAGLDAKGFQRAVQDMSNERGGKALIAVLEGIRAKAKETGSTAQNELARINTAIKEAAGFNAISAAQLSATPLNQLKSVGSAFQTSLFEAFKEIEPLILSVTQKLKAVFTSAGFRETVAGLASSVANLTLLLVEHADKVQYIALAYLAWKGAALGLAAVNGVINLATAALTLKRNAALQTAAALTAVEAAGKRAALANLAFLGPLGAVIGAVGLAWMAYKATQSEASVADADGAKIRNELVNKSLDEEIKRLEKVNQELNRTTSEKLANARAERALAAEEKNRRFNAEAEPLRQQIAQGRSLQSIPRYAALAAGDALPQNPEEYAALNKIRGVPAAEAQLNALYSSSYMTRGQISEQEYKAQRVAELSAANAELVRPEPRTFGGEGWDDAKEAQARARAEAAAAAQLRREESRLTKLLSLEQQAFNRDLKLTEEHAKRELALEDERLRLGLTTQRERDELALKLEEQTFEKRLQIGANYWLAIKDNLGKLQALGTESGQSTAENYIETFKGVMETGAAELDLSKAKAALKLQASFTIDDVPVPKSAFEKWREQLREWQDIEKVLTDSRESFMSGFISMGRDMWGEFIRTGKTSSKQFKDLLINTLADISYKRFFAEPLAKLGNQFFDTVLKPQATAGTPENSADSMKYLSSIASGLGDSLSQLGTSFWEMFRMAGQGLAAMLQTAGSTGAGSWGDALASLFSGGWSANSSTYYPSATGDFALGGAFQAGVQAFARGSAFGSDILHAPQMFRFGLGGANLGVAGEAGPEAIMPLARAADGSLGVRAQNPGGVTNVSVQPKTQVIIEDHSNGGAKPQITQQRQPNGDEMIRVVIGAMNRDMARGGSTRKALKQHTTAQSNLPRY